MKTITLTKQDQELAMQIAMQRYSADRSAGVKDARVGKKRSAYETDLLGVAGEIAFARIFNLSVNHLFDTTPRSGGIDFVLPNGDTVDVKTTTRHDGDLLVRPQKATSRNHAQIYVLVVGDLETFTFTVVGWASEDRVFNQANIRELIPGRPTHVIPQSRLWPLIGGM